MRYCKMIRKTLIGCLVLGLSTGCGRKEASSPTAPSPPHSQKLSFKTAIAGDSAAAPGHALTEAEVQERYSAVNPDSPYFYPGKKHPVNYSTWSLQRPEGKLEHRLSDRFSNFELTTQHGKKVRFYDDLVKDHIVVISFVYTKCNGI
jgi:hypothetical protein